MGKIDKRMLKLINKEIKLTFEGDAWEPSFGYRENRKQLFVLLDEYLKKRLPMIDMDFLEDISGDIDMMWRKYFIKYFKLDEHVIEELNNEQKEQ